MTTTVRVLVESVERRVFVSALDWPGWARSGKTEEAAVETLLAYAPRYAAVARVAGVTFPAKGVDLDVVDRVAGDASTQFGIPAIIVEADRERVTAATARRLASVVEAAWTVFDRVAADAPPTLRKGPRGGGRDTAKIVRHVTEADDGYARVLGIKLPADAVTERRRAVLDVLGQPSDGTPIAGRKWPLRYAARRIAWHALDHAWEIEDRSDPDA